MFVMAKESPIVTDVLQNSKNEWLISRTTIILFYNLSNTATEYYYVMTNIDT